MKVHTATLASLGLVAEEPRRRYGARRSPVPVPAPDALADLSQVQVPYGAIEVVAERLGVEPESLLEIVGMAPRTAARRKAGGQLKPDEADRLFRIVRVFDEAVRVFDSPVKAAIWLRTPHPLLWQFAPVRLLDSDAGAKAVTDELIRIEYGEFA
jgi:putative toxin-antitoxin system antitoxin component (TIGR02293 family)